VKFHSAAGLGSAAVTYMLDGRQWVFTTASALRCSSEAAVGVVTTIAGHRAYT